MLNKKSKRLIRKTNSKNKKGGTHAPSDMRHTLKKMKVNNFPISHLFNNVKFTNTKNWGELENNYSDLYNMENEEIKDDILDKLPSIKYKQFFNYEKARKKLKTRETNFPQNTIEVGDVVTLAQGITDKKGLLSNVPAKVTDVHSVGTIEVKEINDDGNGEIRKFFIPEDLNIIYKKKMIDVPFVEKELKKIRRHLGFFPNNTNSRKKLLKSLNNAEGKLSFSKKVALT